MYLCVLVCVLVCTCVCAPVCAAVYLCMYLCAGVCAPVVYWCVPVWMCMFVYTYTHNYSCCHHHFLPAASGSGSDFLERPDKEWQVNEEGNMVEGHCPLLCGLETLTQSPCAAASPVQPSRLPFTVGLEAPQGRSHVQ